MNKYIINSRADLDSIKGTPEYDEFMTSLRGSMTYQQNVQVYPENYGTPGYEGSILEPIWETAEDLSTITRFGFTKEDFS